MEQKVAPSGFARMPCVESCACALTWDAKLSGASFSSLDVFVQVTAGVRVTEPGADLAVAAALLSSLQNRPTPADALFLGEIGLGGEVRPVGGVERRLAEASRLGFRRAFGSRRLVHQVAGIAHVGLDHVDQLVRALAA